MKKTNILFIDDDQSLQSVVKDYLMHFNYHVEGVTSPTLALSLIKNNTYDLFICDLNLGQVSGFQLIEAIKLMHPKTPIIVLTGSESFTDELHGLELLVHDYLKKPISLAVLEKRIDLVLSRAAKLSMELFSLKDHIVIYLDKVQIYQNNEVVHLTQIEFKLMVYFLSHKNKLLSRVDIFNHVWETSSDQVDVTSLNVHIRSLRKKMTITCLRTIMGVGYEWVE